jgi:hypothetical protein
MPQDDRRLCVCCMPFGQLFETEAGPAQDSDRTYRSPNNFSDRYGDRILRLSEISQPASVAFIWSDRCTSAEKYVPRWEVACSLILATA